MGRGDAFLYLVAWRLGKPVIYSTLNRTRYALEPAFGFAAPTQEMSFGDAEEATREVIGWYRIALQRLATNGPIPTAMPPSGGAVSTVARSPHPPNITGMLVKESGAMSSGIRFVGFVLYSVAQSSTES